MQNDKVQGILFDSENLLDLTKKSRRQKVLLRLGSSKRTLQKVIANRNSLQPSVKGPTYMRNRQAVVSSSDDIESALSDLMERFHIVS